MKELLLNSIFQIKIWYDVLSDQSLLTYIQCTNQSILQFELIDQIAENYEILRLWLKN